MMYDIMIKSHIFIYKSLWIGFVRIADNIYYLAMIVHGNNLY